MEMESHVGLAPHSIMQLRKVLNFNTVLGITLPKEFTNKLDLEPKDYVEVSLAPDRKIVIEKHQPFRPARDLTEKGENYANI